MYQKFSSVTKILTTLFFLQFSFSSHAAIVTLEDWVFNIDGTISEDFFGDPLPTTGSLTDGLGQLSLEVMGQGSHSILGYFDFEISESLNTFFNESGAASGTPAIGQSWEIDETGFYFGDIIDNVLIGGPLDNSSGVTVGNEEDVGFAIGWGFSLLDGDVATIDYVFTDVLPNVDFFLTQTDPDLNESIYFYSSLNVVSTGTPPGPDVPTTNVPEPFTLSLLSLGLIGLLGQRKFIKNDR